MARPRSPDGRRVTIAARLSESEASAVDTVLGDLTRSEWVRSLILAALSGIELAAPVRQEPQRRAATPRRAAPASLPPRREPPREFEPPPAACRHPAEIVFGGVCECGEEFFA